MRVVHWDDVEPVAIENGDLRGTRWHLGAAELAYPPHRHWA